MATALISARRDEEIDMGTWDIGPFENDMVADFADALDEVTEDGREALVRATLVRAVRAREPGRSRADLRRRSSATRHRGARSGRR
ncbi:DUF4259 domain-containing protein [Kitasatospora nipponensis]|uniref:DUF4259 domain-containing protein n=1 Tax=Kitasatospora nipponensis TaxID=258049 RepID=UPI0031DAE4C8